MLLTLELINLPRDPVNCIWLQDASSTSLAVRRWLLLSTWRRWRFSSPSDPVPSVPVYKRQGWAWHSSRVLAETLLYEMAARIQAWGSDAVCWRRVRSPEVCCHCSRPSGPFTMVAVGPHPCSWALVWDLASSVMQCQLPPPTGMCSVDVAYLQI